MQTVTEIALEQAPGGIFTRHQAACWLKATGARLDDRGQLRGAARFNFPQEGTGGFSITSKTLTEIAVETGFGSLSLFSRNIGKYIGQSPSAYRHARAQRVRW